MGKSCFFTKENSRNECQPCRIGNADALFERYKILCSPGSPNSIGKKGAASIRAIIRKICKIEHDCVRNSACDSFISMLCDDKLNPSALPPVGEFLSDDFFSGFYISVSIDRLRDIFCSARFNAQTLPFFSRMLRSTGKEHMYLAVESICALFRNPGFENGWLAQDNYGLLVKIIGAMNPKPSQETVPYPFFSFASLLASKGFSIAELPKAYDGMQGLDGIEMARYFSSLEKDRHPNAMQNA